MLSVALSFKDEYLPYVNVVLVVVILGLIVKFIIDAGESATAAQERRRKDRKGGSGGKKFYTAAEVAKHNKRDDLWMIIKDKVYDVTREVEDHVGGDAILKNAGLDNTKGFFGEQHTSSAHDILPDCYIGELKKEGSAPPDKKED